jgi:Ca2+-transporting ATPase
MPIRASESPDLDSPMKEVPEAIAWHECDPHEVALQHGVDLSVGLPSTQAQARAARFGPNALNATQRRSWAGLLLDQFKDFMVLVLLAAAVIAVPVR